MKPLDITAKPAGFVENLKSDLPASFVVFLVALPLCMGISIASGAPPVTGLITGIIGGLVVGWISGSPLQVSGPAAGLAVLVYELINRYQNQFRADHADATDAQAITYALGVLGVVILVAGVLQLAAGLLRLGQWFRAVSPAVVQGMLAGIGLLIFAGQFHVMVHDKPREDGLANLMALPEAVYKGIFPLDERTLHHYAAWTGLATIAVIVGWSLMPKKFKIVPAPLLAVLVATGLTWWFQLPIVKVMVPDNVFAGAMLPSTDTLRHLLDQQVILAALAVALVASAETLLCATAVDQLHNGPRTKYDKELASQGVGNILCGLLGGLPMTGVIVRSSANVQAGAKTRASAILHGLWMLLFVSFLPWALKLIPIAGLAAVLVYTGYKLMNPKAVRELWKFGKSEVAIYFATMSIIVVKDLLTGVIVGIVLSVLKLLFTFSHLRIDVEEKPSRNRTVLHLSGAATFIRLPKLAAVLDGIRPGSELHVQFDRLTYIDHACLDLLMNWEKQQETTGGRLVIDWESLHARFRAVAARREASAPVTLSSSSINIPSDGAARLSEKHERPTTASKAY